MDWLWHAFLSFALGVIPTWVWIIVAGAVLGVAWRYLGWQGLIGVALAILTIGAYRQGWRDHGDGKAPLVPVEEKPPDRAPSRKPRPPPKAKSWFDDVTKN